MAKKKKQIKETTIENYYDLKVDKVDELVAALKNEEYVPDENDLTMFISDCTGVDDPKNYTRSGKKKEFDPYKSDFLGKVPVWTKAIFVKWWFAAMVCYFIMFGLESLMHADRMDMVVLSGIVMGLVVEILVNPCLRFMERGEKEYNAYMMFPFPFKAYWTFFTNVLYYVIVIVGVNFCYLGLNQLILIMRPDATNLVYVEPLLYATFTVIVDMVFIGIKDLIVYLVKRSKKEKTQNV